MDSIDECEPEWRRVFQAGLRLLEIPVALVGLAGLCLEDDPAGQVRILVAAVGQQLLGGRELVSPRVPTAWRGRGGGARPTRMVHSSSRSDSSSGLSRAGLLDQWQGRRRFILLNVMPGQEREGFQVIGKLASSRARPLRDRPDRPNPGRPRPASCKWAGDPGRARGFVPGTRSPAFSARLISAAVVAGLSVRERRQAERPVGSARSAASVAMHLGHVVPDHRLGQRLLRRR